MKKILLIITFIICGLSISTAQTTTTVGLLKHTVGSLDDGYILFSPVVDSTTFLIDKCGYVVNSWKSSYLAGLAVYLLPNGKLLRCGRDMNSVFVNGNAGGYLELFGWDSKLEWSIHISDTTECLHHDVKYLPNGNILCLMWEKKTYDEAISQGRNPAKAGSQIWSEKIVEIRPIGSDSAEIVWEWDVWDHLVQDFNLEQANFGEVSAHPELIDINYFTSTDLKDWLHLNSVDYNPITDQILISCRHFNEIWVIDHSTTKSEAASHKGGKYGKGGDLLYRWGNPQTYRHGATEDQQLFLQHNAYWIPYGLPYAGKIMVFNNSKGPANGKFSTVDIIVQPVDENGFYNQSIPFEPASPVWEYIATPPTNFYAFNLSSAQMLKNGNVLICNGPTGVFSEIDNTKNIVWQYMNPVVVTGICKQGEKPKLTNNVFRCTYYPDDYSGLAGRDLSRKGLIEDVNSNSNGCTLFNTIDDNENNVNSSVYPNPANNLLKIETDLTDYTVEMFDIRGKPRIYLENVKDIDIQILENGIYFVKITSKDKLLINYYNTLVWR